jgi:hypothetical protein
VRLLVFLHGTVLMHSGAIGVTRAERVAQVRAGHPTISDYAAYVPVDGAVAKLHRWEDAGAQIDYLCSHRNPDGVALDAFVLRMHGFPPGRVLARQPGESYGDVAGREAPDVLIEDDCESIGLTRSRTRRYRPTCALGSSPSSSPSSAASTTSPMAPGPADLRSSIGGLTNLSPPGSTSPETARSVPQPLSH